MSSFRAAQELVDGAAAAFPVAVVVDEDEAARDDEVVEILQADLRRVVPVAVETQHGDRADLVFGGKAASPGTSPGGLTRAGSMASFSKNSP
jgi:hypothetical protein